MLSRSNEKGRDPSERGEIVIGDPSHAPLYSGLSVLRNEKGSQGNQDKGQTEGP